MKDPFFDIINHDCYLEHGRNAYVKNDIFMVQTMKQSHIRKTFAVISNEVGH